MLLCRLVLHLCSPPNQSPFFHSWSLKVSVEGLRTVLSTICDPLSNPQTRRWWWMVLSWVWPGHSQKVVTSPWGRQWGHQWPGKCLQALEGEWLQRWLCVGSCVGWRLHCMIGGGPMPGAGQWQRHPMCLWIALCAQVNQQWRGWLHFGWTWGVSHHQHREEILCSWWILGGCARCCQKHLPQPPNEPAGLLHSLHGEWQSQSVVGCSNEHWHCLHGGAPSGNDAMLQSHLGLLRISWQELVLVAWLIVAWHRKAIANLVQVVMVMWREEKSANCDSNPKQAQHVHSQGPSMHCESLAATSDPCVVVGWHGQWTCQWSVQDHQVFHAIGWLLAKESVSGACLCCTPFPNPGQCAVLCWQGSQMSLQISWQCLRLSIQSRGHGCNLAQRSCPMVILGIQNAPCWMEGRKKSVWTWFWVLWLAIWHSMTAADPPCHPSICVGSRPILVHCLWHCCWSSCCSVDSIVQVGSALFQLQLLVQWCLVQCLHQLVLGSCWRGWVSHCCLIVVWTSFFCHHSWCLQNCCQTMAVCWHHGQWRGAWSCPSQSFSPLSWFGWLQTLPLDSHTFLLARPVCLWCRQGWSFCCGICLFWSKLLLVVAPSCQCQISNVQPRWWFSWLVASLLGLGAWSVWVPCLQKSMLSLGGLCWRTCSKICALHLCCSPAVCWQNCFLVWLLLPRFCSNQRPDSACRCFWSQGTCPLGSEIFCWSLMKMWHCAFPNCDCCCVHLSWFQWHWQAAFLHLTLFLDGLQTFPISQQTGFPQEWFVLAVLGVSVVILGVQDLLSTSNLWVTRRNFLVSDRWHCQCHWNCLWEDLAVVFIFAVQRSADSLTFSSKILCWTQGLSAFNGHRSLLMLHWTLLAFDLFPKKSWIRLPVFPRGLSQSLQVRAFEAFLCHCGGWWGQQERPIHGCGSVWLTNLGILHRTESFCTLLSTTLSLLDWQWLLPGGGKQLFCSQTPWLRLRLVPELDFKDQSSLPFPTVQFVSQQLVVQWIRKCIPLLAVLLTQTVSDSNSSHNGTDSPPEQAQGQHFLRDWRKQLSQELSKEQARTVTETGRWDPLTGELTPLLLFSCRLLNWCTGCHFQCSFLLVWMLLLKDTGGFVIIETHWTAVLKGMHTWACWFCPLSLLSKLADFVSICWAFGNLMNLWNSVTMTMTPLWLQHYWWSLASSLATKPLNAWSHSWLLGWVGERGDNAKQNKLLQLEIDSPEHCESFSTDWNMICDPCAFLWCTELTGTSVQ